MSTRIPDELDENARLAEIRGRLLDAVAQRRTPRFSRARKVGVGAAAAGLALALTGGAIAIVQASQEHIDHSVRCYATADLGSLYTQVATATAIDDATGEEAREVIVDAVETCGEMWRMGVVGQETAPIDPNAANFPVPDLVGCTLTDGIRAAFPNLDGAPAEEVCRDLGLPVTVG